MRSGLHLTRELYFPSQEHQELHLFYFPNYFPSGWGWPNPFFTDEEMEEKTNGKTKATLEIKGEACSTVRYAVRKDRLYLRDLRIPGEPWCIFVLSRAYYHSPWETLEISRMMPMNDFQITLWLNFSIPEALCPYPSWFHLERWYWPLNMPVTSYPAPYTSPFSLKGTSTLSS